MVLKKYITPENEKESKILPNLLNTKSQKLINEKEFEGFYFAETFLLENLTSETRINLNYIRKIHKLALSEVYSFAGNFRKVNLSKEGFLFPSAMFIESSMKSLEKKFLISVNKKFRSLDKLLKINATIHAELLFIHPFREGNGRVARILANIIMYKNGFNRIRFEKLTGKNWGKYIEAVQAAGLSDYTKMEKLFRKII